MTNLFQVYLKYRMAFKNLIDYTIVYIIQRCKMEFNAKGATWKKSTMRIRKYLEMANNEYTTYHYLCGVAKVLL